MSANGRTIWCVVTRPKAQTACGDRPAILRPRSSTVPAVGEYTPERRRKSVVFPAPLGPMRP